MTLPIESFAQEFDPKFKVFHELMARKVRDILLVSTPYDAWIMEEDCRLSERIIHEYRGLNLSNPPRITWVPTAEAAVKTLSGRKFDMVLTMAGAADPGAHSLGLAIKRVDPELPVVQLSHQAAAADAGADFPKPPGVDRTFVWSGNTDLLVALVKSAEDRLNADHDTTSAGIRVILLVEDSPVYISSLLPLLYKEVVTQTQRLLEEGLNEEHRLLTMRARPKILVAEDYESAVGLFERYEPYILGVISDVRYPRGGRPYDDAGVDFLRRIRQERFDIPLLLTSSDPFNAARAAAIPARFAHKLSPTLHEEVRAFFLEQLGFGDFVFRRPDGSEIARAATLRTLETLMAEVPDDCFVQHCLRNDFSRWLFARTEITLANKLRPIRHADFGSIDSHRRYLVSLIGSRRSRRQKGVVANFEAGAFDLDTEFFKVGKGSLGGKARGLAFVGNLLQRVPDIHRRFESVRLFVPQTLVVTTDAFDAFVAENDLKRFATRSEPDETAAEAFGRADFPAAVADDLRAYLSRITYPLAVRSSSLLEDAKVRAYAGLYRTCMLPNDHPSLDVRLRQLIEAVKLIYASTYFQNPRAFSHRVGHRIEEEKMAVIVQKLVGRRHGRHFYPSISGAAQSYNYYPFGAMRPEDGIATIALGLGRTVMEGEKALRFCPRHPQLLPQRSTVKDILANSQRFFYSLRMDGSYAAPGLREDAVLEKREVVDVPEDPDVRALSGYYLPREERIREAFDPAGTPVLTFSQVLKYDLFPLPQLLADVLAMGQDGMGCPVELEFAVDLPPAAGEPPGFALLQLRPMTSKAENVQVTIGPEEETRAFCSSSQALGNGEKEDLADIVFVKPDAFEVGRTPEIAREIGQINAGLTAQGRRYLLVGPGRWGSADRWLGIPVSWADICSVSAMVETTAPDLKADPSQGSHFFHNITTLDITYCTVNPEAGDRLDWGWLTAQPRAAETRFVAHVRLPRPFVVKADGRTSRCVMIATER
ncbi:MAG: phosphoenolpyruvate synthase/pyruvate phosphate dikinase [Desulfobacterales bacterium]|nr:phosphoenolpyruvate synthase/pyruvate phosphate dikinase [Desulfobacterales bacterium]